MWSLAILDDVGGGKVRNLTPRISWFIWQMHVKSDFKYVFFKFIYLYIY